MTDCCKLNLNSLNVRGISNGPKRKILFQWLSKNHNGIIFLQETHSSRIIEKEWERDWNGDIVFNHGTNKSCGVAIQFPNKMDVKINETKTDDNGRLLLLDVIIDDQNIILLNVYAPTKDRPDQQMLFLDKMKKFIDDFLDRNILIGGDLNTYLDPKIDKTGGKEINEQSIFGKGIKLLCEEMNLIDIYRILNPDKRRFSWRGVTRSGIVQSRLDYWLVSTHMLYDLIETDIKPCIRTDHSLITLSFNLTGTQKRGRGFWKFNTGLLNDKKYTNIINELIIKLTGQYRD